MPDGPTFAELKGKRLGAVERGIFLAAGGPALTNALILRATSGKRSEQEGIRRAARRLERLRLIRIVKIKEGIRAYDPRLQDPVYWEGQFLERNDKTRRQLVPRLVCWKTVFGEALLNAYREEFTERKPIRWKLETYEQISRVASLSQVDHLTWEMAVSDVSIMLEQSPPAVEGGQPVTPGNYGPGELGRWKLSVQVAVARNPGAGSARLYEEARELMESEMPLEALSREAPGEPARPPGKTVEPRMFDDNFAHARKRLIEEQNRKQILSTEN